MLPGLHSPTISALTWRATLPVSGSGRRVIAPVSRLGAAKLSAPGLIPAGLSPFGETN